MRQTTIDLDRLRELHAQGLSDNKIAKLIGCNQKTVSLYRSRIGLPPNYRPMNASGTSVPCGERLPDHLRPRLRLLLLALSRFPDTWAWAECWRYFRWLEGRPEAALVPQERQR